MSVMKWTMAGLAVVAAAVCWGADVTGDWSAQMGGPDGDGPKMMFHFKQSGTTLTGTIDGPGGQPMEIKEGKVEGEKLSFVVVMERDGEQMKIRHEGKIAGDEITLEIKMGGRGPGGPGGGPGGPGGGPGGPGGGGPRPMTLKRVK